MTRPRRDESRMLAVCGLLARSGALGSEPMEWSARRERLIGAEPRDVYDGDTWDALEDLRRHDTTEVN